MTSGNKFKSYFFFFHLLGVCVALPCFAQNICTNLPSGAVAGDFELSGNVYAGCSPFNTTVVDKSGGTDIRYDFYYTKKTPAQLDTVGNLNPSNAYFVNTATSVYTILQYGKKNGKDMYACKNVTVRPNNKPVFSYTSCNLNFLNLIIPKDPANNFDFYTIDWGDGTSIVTVNSLPSVQNKNYSSSVITRDIKITGHNTIPTGCAPPPFQTVKMDGSGDFPRITELETLEGGKKVKLTFTGAFDKHQIYQRAVTGTYSFPNFKLESNPGTLEIPLIGTEQNCFMIYKNPACIQLSGEVCTIKLDSIKPQAAFANIVSFERHPINIVSTILNFSKVLKIDYQINSQITSGTTITNLSLIPNNSPFVHNITNCTAKYCYQTLATVTGEWGVNPSIPYTSLVKSEKMCLDRKTIVAPALTDVKISVESSSKVKIDFKENTSWPIAPKSFVLFKDSLGVFSRTDSINSLTSSSKFFNQNVNTLLEKQCYKVGFQDNCESSSALSNTVCSINLNLSKNEDLSWTILSPFSNSIIDRFELFEVNENSGFETKVIDLGKDAKDFTPDFSSFQVQAKYRIKAINSNQQESYSNYVEIPIAADFYLPSSFSPDSNGFNDTFEVKGRMGRVKLFQMDIFNRWGEKVAELKDKLQSWDGTSNGFAALTGIYYYKLKIVLSDDQKINQEGSFELLR